jgi:hypothetical protein
MGFDRKQALWALRHNEGDFDAALGYLAAGGDCGGMKVEEEVVDPASPAKKLTGKKLKDAKKASKGGGGGGEGKGGAGGGGGGQQGGGEQTCNVCKEVFASRSKLFQHIKETGHALYDPRQILKSSLYRA